MHQVRVAYKINYILNIYTDTNLVHRLVGLYSINNTIC